jgi:hypothetical protein
MKLLVMFSIIALLVFSCRKDDTPPKVTKPEQLAETDLDLLPHFGQFTTPNSADSICEKVSYKGDFDENAYPIEQKVNNFTLYDKDGVAVNLESELPSRLTSIDLFLTE